MGAVLVLPWRYPWPLLDQLIGTYQQPSRKFDPEHPLTDPCQRDILHRAHVIWSTGGPIPVCYADD